MNESSQPLATKMGVEDYIDNNRRKRADVKKHEESKRRGVRVSDNHVVDSRSNTGLSSSPNSNTSQPSERKHRESSMRSPRNKSPRRMRPSEDRRRINYRTSSGQYDQRQERHHYDRSRHGDDRHHNDRFELERYGRDLRGTGKAPYFHREHDRRRSMDHHGPRSRSIDSHSRSRSRPRLRSSHIDIRESRSRSRSYSSSSSSVSSSSGSSEDEVLTGRDESTFSKDQRTVFVSQLVMRATEKDIRRYFRRKVGCIVREVILLRDKRMRSHKGGAYIEMGRIEDVNKAVAVSGTAPDFQRFPLLVKLSEAEKNYVAPATAALVTASTMGASSPSSSSDGRKNEAKQVYVGNLDMGVSEEHLFAIFSQFGHLVKVSMQMNPGTQSHKGFAFLTFRDPKVANLAIHTMANKELAGRPMRTGWANQEPCTFAVEVMTSDEFPEDSKGRKKRAFAVLEQLTGPFKTGEPDKASDGIESQTAGNTQPLTVDLTVVDSPGLKGEPKPNILVHNMFDKDSETEEGWADDLKDEFIQECSKFGRILAVTIMSNESGGKVIASFDTIDSAKLCAHNLSGRWFDKRQLQVEFVNASRLPDGHFT